MENFGTMIKSGYNVVHDFIRSAFGPIGGDKVQSTLDNIITGAPYTERLHHHEQLTREASDRAHSRIEHTMRAAGQADGEKIGQPLSVAICDITNDFATKGIPYCDEVRKAGKQVGRD